jgi:hypothetical protein
VIVLDEHLLTKKLDDTIRRWYPGSVVGVLDLRPDTIIKDEAIPGLLGQQNDPVFVTINVSDFWQRLPVSDKFCMACFALTSSEIPQIPDLLRRLFRHESFNTKAKRAGKVVRITASGQATFYEAQNQTVRNVDEF